MREKSEKNTKRAEIMQIFNFLHMYFFVDNVLFYVTKLIFLSLSPLRAHESSSQQQQQVDHPTQQPHRKVKLSRTDSVRTQTSIQLLDENLSLIGTLNAKGDRCRCINVLKMQKSLTFLLYFFGMP